MLAKLGNFSPRTNSNSPSRRSSQSPSARMPDSNFYGGTFQRSSYDVNNGTSGTGLPAMMQTKENAYKLRAIESVKRVDSTAFHPSSAEKTEYEGAKHGMKTERQAPGLFSVQKEAR